MISKTGSRGDRRSQVVRNEYCTRPPPGLVVVRRLSVAEVRARRLDDLREADHGDQVVVLDRPAVDLFEEAAGLVEPPELRVVVLDVTPTEARQRLHLDVVDHRGEEFLARAVAEADRHPDQLAALVLR